jgi:thiamine pyrophosphate-dependent acetolactate synthase large subunit-like protein
MKRFECLQILSKMITDELVVLGMTGIHWEWNHLSRHEGNMKIGSMGNAAAVALGMALGLPNRRVIGLESDGSTLLDLATVTTMGRYLPGNLKIFVFDNQVYSGSRISQPTVTGVRASLEAIAKGAGVESAITIRDVESFEREARLALSENGLRYVVVKVEEDTDARKLPKPTMDYLEHKYHFVRYIERTEGKTILPSHR